MPAPTPATMVTTLSPCDTCAGEIVLNKIRGDHRREHVFCGGEGRLPPVSEPRPPQLLQKPRATAVLVAKVLDDGLELAAATRAVEGALELLQPLHR